MRREGMEAGEAHPYIRVWETAQKYQELLLYDVQLLHSESVLQGMSASSASTENKGCIALNSARLHAPVFLGAIFILLMLWGETDLLHLRDVLCVHLFQEVSHWPSQREVMVVFRTLLACLRTSEVHPKLCWCAVILHCVGGLQSQDSSGPASIYSCVAGRGA